MATKVIHIKDAPTGWRENPAYVFIGRPSKWGNPFSHLEYSKAQHQVVSREAAVLFYEQRLLQEAELMNSLGELKDRILVCYCHPKACHGHVLAKHADKIKWSDEILAEKLGRGK
jgi:hypothetical protein